MEIAHAVSVRRRFDLGWVAWAFGAAALVLLFLAVGLVLGRSPVPVPVVAAFGVGLLGTLALALSRYDAAVALGVLLLAVVRIEPAPSDLVFAVVIAVAFVTGRLFLERVPLSVSVLVAGFLALNLLAATVATDSARAVAYFAITLYLGVFGLWFAAYVCSVRRARLVLLALPGRRGALGRRRLPGAPRALPRRFRVRGRAPRAGPVQGSERLRPVSRPCRPDPDGGDRRAAPAAFRLSTKLMLLSVLTVGVVFSFSRAAWLNLAVGMLVLLVVLALRRGGGRRAMTMLAVALVAGAALFGVVAATSSASFLTERAGLQDYDVQRFGTQATGLEIAATHPLGIGPGQFEAVSELSAHSTYVRALAEEGVPGALLVFALMLLTLGFAARNVALGVDTYGIGSAALLAAWCGLLVNSSFVDTLHWRHLWLVAALIWAGTALRAGYPGR